MSIVAHLGSSISPQKNHGEGEFFVKRLGFGFEYTRTHSPSPSLTLRDETGTDGKEKGTGEGPLIGVFRRGNARVLRQGSPKRSSQALRPGPPS